jgi:hypothetical protein
VSVVFVGKNISIATAKVSSSENGTTLENVIVFVPASYPVAVTNQPGPNPANKTKESKPTPAKLIAFARVTVTVKVESPLHTAVAFVITGGQHGDNKSSKALYKDLESKCLTKAKIDLLIAEGFL